MVLVDWIELGINKRVFTHDDGHSWDNEIGLKRFGRSEERNNDEKVKRIGEITVEGNRRIGSRPKEIRMNIRL